jgi:hypothetical protein
MMMDVKVTETCSGLERLLCNKFTYFRMQLLIFFSHNEVSVHGHEILNTDFT